MDITEKHINLEEQTLKEINKIIKAEGGSMRQVSLKFFSSETTIANILHRAKKDTPYKMTNLLRLWETLNKK